MILPETLESYDHEVIGEAIYFPDMSNNVYHNCAGISSSTIRRFGQSQLHALHETVEASHALRFGSAAHALIVEGESVFNKEVACLSGSPYTQANKQLKADYESRGLVVVSADDRQTIYNMRDNLIPEADKLLHPSENEYPQVFNYPYERALFWFERDLLLKVKSDVVRFPLSALHAEDSVVLVDYKTTQSCEPRSFMGSVKKYQYDLQAAWYKRAYEKAGFKVNDFLFVAQEKKPPYASKIFRMKPEDLEAGWLELDRLLGEYIRVQEGREPSVYNTPSYVEIEL